MGGYSVLLCSLSWGWLFSIFVIYYFVREDKYTTKKRIPSKNPLTFYFYLISITFVMLFFGSGVLRGSSMQSTPSHMLALMVSFITSSGRIRVCWNLVYENSLRKYRLFFSLHSSLFLQLSFASTFFSMAMTRFPFSSTCTWKSSLFMPGAATSTLYSVSVSITLMAGAVAFVFFIHSVSKKSSNMAGNQLWWYRFIGIINLNLLCLSNTIVSRSGFPTG